MQVPYTTLVLLYFIVYLTKPYIVASNHFLNYKLSFSDRNRALPDRIVLFPDFPWYRHRIRFRQYRYRYRFREKNGNGNNLGLFRSFPTVFIPTRDSFTCCTTTSPPSLLPSSSFLDIIFDISHKQGSDTTCWPSSSLTPPTHTLSAHRRRRTAVNHKSYTTTLVISHIFPNNHTVLH